MKFTRSVLTILLILLVIPLVTLAASGQTSEEASLQAQIEQVLQEVDSSKFGSSVSTGEFIVRAYQLVDHRQPDAFEFYYCKLLVTQNHLTRSNLLALIMAGDDNQISWDKCRILMHAGPVNFFKNTSAIKRDVEKLQNAPKEQIIQHYREKLANQAVKTSAGNSPKLLSSSNGSLVSSAVSGANIPYDTYQTYFGYLHAHTSFSDGSGTPEEAYQYAREIGKLDFFAITDHGELIIFWPW
ncbi:MAG TPA: hypothetical protein DDW50_15205, partial [Firmicutes bacterium]|nr:hypothetical protein [Bacillota bacterium]